MIEGFTALYIFMLAAFTGYEVIGRVPVILHTPLMSGSNFVHGIVDDLQDVEFVEGELGIGQLLLDAFDKGRGHVAADVLNCPGIAVMS